MQLPGANDRILDRIVIAGLEIGDDHHVLSEAVRDGEGLRERLQQDVSEIERLTVSGAERLDAEAIGELAMSIAAAVAAPLAGLLVASDGLGAAWAAAATAALVVLAVAARLGRSSAGEALA